MPSNKHLNTLPTPVRSILSSINATLEQGGDSARILWDILTGLRGPDDGSFDSKDATTSVIRGTVFSKQAMRQTGAAMLHPDEESDYHTKARVGRMNQTHFVQHAKNAFKALGLNWDSSNAPKKPAYVPPSNLKTTGTIWEAY